MSLTNNVGAYTLITRSVRPLYSRLSQIVLQIHNLTADIGLYASIYNGIHRLEKAIEGKSAEGKEMT
jgi:hypothetical protein